MSIDWKKNLSSSSTRSGGAIDLVSTKNIEIELLIVYGWMVWHTAGCYYNILCIAVSIANAIYYKSVCYGGETRRLLIYEIGIF
jgi:hypothetical protein